MERDETDRAIQERNLTVCPQCKAMYTVAYTVQNFSSFFFTFLQSMLLHDQLTCEILAGECNVCTNHFQLKVSFVGNVFNGFSEQPISFLPSYKYDIHSDEFDTSELRRVPSWTVSYYQRNM